MIATPVSLKAEIEQELLKVDDARVVTLVRSLLVEPTAITLDWDYGQPDERYPAWIVLDDSAGSGTLIVYCEQGFGPQCPWGLMSSDPVDGRRGMGMDSGWYPTFMQAFFESWAAQRIETLTLWRPVGPAELRLIAESGYRAFPPRLPEQPIFYPVLNEAYATQIARDWNAKADGGGYVTRFEVRREFLDRYGVHQAGGREHLEYWIPAEDLPAFNDAIVGEIAVVSEFKPPAS